MNEPYQYLPPLTDDEREALTDSVATFGVLQAVITDKDGNILDGHHRAEIAIELGVEYPTVVLDGLTEEQKVEQALILNLGRRNLDADQKAALVQNLRSGGLSIRWISEKTGIPRSSVQRYSSAVPHGTPEYVSGKDGKRYQAEKPRQRFDVEEWITECAGKIPPLFDPRGRHDADPEWGSKWHFPRFSKHCAGCNYTWAVGCGLRVLSNESGNPKRYEKEAARKLGTSPAHVGDMILVADEFITPPKTLDTQEDRIRQGELLHWQLTGEIDFEKPPESSPWAVDSEDLATQFQAIVGYNMTAEMIDELVAEAVAWFEAGNMPVLKSEREDEE